MPEGPATNWQELVFNSHYQTAVAVRDELAQGHVEEARRGLEELIDALSRAERRALRAHLIRLMAHIIKWHTQPERRSRSWTATIRNARREIADIQEETPSLNRAVIERLWARCFEMAQDDAEAEMGQPSAVASLTWADVFEVEYRVGDQS
jgi:AcrR family transcriptional regulator